MVVMAEGWLQVLEAKAIDEALNHQPPMAPLTFFRFVDNSHSRFNEIAGAETFLRILNSQDPSTQYTMEVEWDDKELTVLEVRWINSGQGAHTNSTLSEKRP